MVLEKRFQGRAAQGCRNGGGVPELSSQDVTGDNQPKEGGTGDWVSGGEERQDVLGLRCFPTKACDFHPCCQRNTASASLQSTSRWGRGWGLSEDTAKEIRDPSPMGSAGPSGEGVSRMSRMPCRVCSKPRHRGSGTDSEKVDRGGLVC